MEKLVVKTAVKTVLVILGVVLVVFAIFNFAFPQHMATFTEGIGNYPLAVKYASLRYSYTGDGEDLSRCFDDSVLAENDVAVVEYGDKLIARSDFDRLCFERDNKMGVGYDYRHSVYRKLAVSYYRTGRKEESVELASKANGTLSFTYGNALMSLSAVVRSANDGATCALIIKKLEGLTPSVEQEKGYVKEVTNSLRAVVVSNGLNN